MSESFCKSDSENRSSTLMTMIHSTLHRDKPAENQDLDSFLQLLNELRQNPVLDYLIMVKAEKKNPDRLSSLLAFVIRYFVNVEPHSNHHSHSYC